MLDVRKQAEQPCKSRKADMEADTVRIMSRRMVRPSYGAMAPMPPPEDIRLTPSDLHAISPAVMIQIGILMPKPPAADGGLVDTLASSLARALGRYYHFAGRLAIEEHGDDTGAVTVALRCTGEGAELLHAVAPGVAMADVVGSVCTPSSLLRAFFPSLDGVYADAGVGSSLPVVWAQVTELADGVFIGVTMNHAVGDGTCFWELFNAWSATNRGGDDDQLTRAPAPAHQRWVVDAVPVTLSTLQHALRRSVVDLPPVREGFFTFSAANVKKLKAKANDEIEMMPSASATISSLQAVIAHLWRAIARARRLPPGQETSCVLVIGCRGRMSCTPTGYVGNAIAVGMTTGCTAGEIMDKGLGWAAWQLNRAAESFKEEDVWEWVDRWTREPTFLSPAPSDTLTIANSPRFDVFGNDFGWGKPVGVRSSSRNKADGMVWAFEGPEREGSMSLEVSLAPEAMERLVADHEFMEAVVVPPV